MRTRETPKAATVCTVFSTTPTHQGVLAFSGQTFSSLHQVYILSTLSCLRLIATLSLHVHILHIWDQNAKPLKIAPLDSSNIVCFYNSMRLYNVPPTPQLPGLTRILPVIITIHAYLLMTLSINVPDSAKFRISMCHYSILILNSVGTEICVTAHSFCSVLPVAQTWRR